MQRDDTLMTLFKHNLWANLLLLEHCSRLTDGQMAASIPGSFGSIYETWVHMVKAERSYFSRISTGQRYAEPPDEAPMTWADMAASLRRTGEGLLEWVHQVGADDLVTIDWDGTPREVPKTIIITQIINHATEHREQIKAIMTELGIEPPDLQGWAYFDALS